MDRQHNRVFILGAGASADAGVPVMSNFLDVARDHYSSGVVSGFNKYFERLFTAIHKLKGASFYANVDLNNIETVLSLLELGEQIGGIEGVSKNEMRRARLAATRVIGLTIDWSTELSSERKLTGSYPKFVQNIIKPNSRYKDKNAIITFNYDCALDYALVNETIGLSYYLSDKEEIGTVPLLKLHGSTNWQRTGKEKRNVEIAHHPTTSTHSTSQGQRCLLQFATPILEGENSKSNPLFIIPPVLNKQSKQRIIENVWKKASEVLQKAEEIYVIGYSLPETDIFFRYLFALGTHSKASISRFWVFDPDPKVGDRFRDLVGMGLREPRFKFFEMEFEKAIDEILKD